MDEAQTCGKGLAERSILPASFATFVGALAALLTQHEKSIAGDDPNSARERDAYRSLAERYRNVSRELGSVAKEMAGYRSLPMAPHNVSVLISAENAGAFEHVVAAERDIARLLSAMLPRDEEMLRSMK
jgi:hypothetical protein